MLSSSFPELFRKNPEIASKHRVTAEWNYNEVINVEDYGCYKDTYSSTYVKNTGYDTGKSEIFFDGPSVSTTFTGSGTSITVGSGTGIAAGMRVEGKNIVGETYVASVSGTSVTLSKALNASVGSSAPISFYNYLTEYDKDRLIYSPITSIFDKNRPDPGIINLVSNTRYGSPILNIEKLKISNFGNTTGNTREDRIYPIYKNTNFRYWNSIRKILKTNIPETVGISSSTISGSTYPITHAAPFIIYDKGFFINKVVVKTQKYNGYANSFKVEVLLGDSGTTWTEIYNGGSTDLQDGILEIYYNGTSWSSTKQYVTQFIGTPSNAIKINGIRLSINGMSAPNISAEVIELSPRLLADISDYVISFDKISSLNNTSYGVPVSGVVSSTGNLLISNIDFIFSARNPNSILSNLLYEGTKIMFEQVVTSGQTTENIPIGTLYAVSWLENSDFTTRVDLEDYLFFLKAMQSPDIVIANKTGIESSVAILLLLDNAGITNYKFVRKSSSNSDDFVFDYFYSSKDSRMSQTLEDIALSAQYAIFVDANNMINVVTKEKFSELVTAENTNYWLVGSENWTGKTESTYLNNNYVANFSTINEQITQPLTEATVSYKGNSIKKQAYAISAVTQNILDEDTNLLYNASLTTSDLRLSVIDLWDINSDQENATLLGMAYIGDISKDLPSVLQNAKTTPISGTDENSVVRSLYNSMSKEDRKYCQILLDQEFGTLFLSGNKYFGYVLIDSELIKYRGLLLNIFDDKDASKNGNAIVFNAAEFAEIKNNVSTGSSILCVGLLVDLNFETSEISDALLSGNKDYYFISDGRAENGTLLASHIAQSDSPMLQNHFGTKLYASTFNSNIRATGTMTAKSIQIKDPRYNPKIRENLVSYPGYLKISGPKQNWTGDQSSNLGDNTELDNKLPIDNFGERFITGFYQSLPFSPARISTRMKLLAKPDKNFTVAENTSESSVKFYKNRGIAGIGFKLKPSSTGTTGYFLEIEDVGNISTKDLEDGKFNNLRLYRVHKNSAGKFVPKVLGSAWVNTSAIAEEDVDIVNFLLTDSKSYTGASDIVVTVEKTNKNNVYRVFWEDQKVLTVKEDLDSIHSSIDQKSNIVSLFVRSNSEAMFEHLMAAEVSRNGNYPVSTIFGKNSPYMQLQKVASRGLLPAGLSEGMVGTKHSKFYFEDFGRLVREVKKMSIKFDTPAVFSYPITYSRVNQMYYVANYSGSAYGAEFWVFNTSNSNINLSDDLKTPLRISGVGIEQINGGQVTLKEYISKRLGEDNEKITVLDRNLRKFGSNAVNINGEYLNSLSQAEDILDWIIQNSILPKKTLTCEIFTNPLLEIGDKVRIFYPELGYSYEKQGDKVYYIHSISYAATESGPRMTVTVSEV